MCKVLGVPLDTTYRPEGDGGMDFIKNGIRGDAKATPCLNRPHLIVEPEKVERSDYFILTPIDMDRKQGYIRGWLSRDEVRNLPLKSFGGRKPQRASRDIHPGLPPALLG